MPSRRALSGKSQEPRRRYAEELRALRTAKGLSLRELGAAITYDFTHLGRMELGESLGGPELAAALDKFYGTTHLTVLWELALRDPGQFRERYRHYMKLEADALAFQKYAPGLMPGLLQSEPYARSVLTAGGCPSEILDQQVEARMARQHVLDGPRPPHLRAVLSEAVLRAPLADPAAWQEQLSLLAEAAERPQVAIQILPLSLGPQALPGTDIMFLRLRDGRTVAWVETAHSGELVTETLGVERLQLRYDQVRDQALSPAESLTLIAEILEEVPCEPTVSN
ncbi:MULTISPECIES: helix-turn-helix transcriptional regulator [unclassified Streptomyces]|uniref:helix-turn-helix domain-containing protein n=1 Tax=unclassified Streptomyces TaxID=2593676 RepID=UPI000CD57314|nr:MULTISPECIES: helix-turn-helix transcriptional regulator [unclassified Streptomyces]